MTRAETVAWMLSKYGEAVQAGEQTARVLLTPVDGKGLGRWYCIAPATLGIGVGDAIQARGQSYLAESTGETALEGNTLYRWAILRPSGGALQFHWTE